MAVKKNQYGNYQISNKKEDKLGECVSASFRFCKTRIQIYCVGLYMESIFGRSQMNPKKFRFWYFLIRLYSQHFETTKKQFFLKFYNYSFTWMVYISLENGTVIFGFDHFRSFGFSFFCKLHKYLYVI